MKIRSIILLSFAAFIWLQSAAQAPVPFNEPNYNKKKIFTDLPQKMYVKLSGIEGILNYPLGASIDIVPVANFRMSGKVVSRAEQADGSFKSVVVRLNNRDNATFTFSRTRRSDGTYAFMGRVMNRNNGDALELVKENGQYALVKKSLYDLVSE